MAGSTSDVGVAIRKWEAERSVIKRSRAPGSDGMALRTGRGGSRKAGLDVIGNVTAERRRAVPAAEVTSHAVRGVQRIIIVHMARGAWRWRRRHVRAGESKTGRAVIEGSRVPTRSSVAVRAIRNRKGGSRS